MSESKRYAADLIEQFTAGTADRREWDDFVSIRHRDRELNAISNEVIAVADRYPASRAWCSPEGFDALRAIIARLRAELPE